MMFPKVCFESKKGSECFQFLPCEHVFCRSCVGEFFRVQITEGSVNALSCPMIRCHSEATTPQVMFCRSPFICSKIILGGNLYSRCNLLSLLSCFWGTKRCFCHWHWTRCLTSCTVRGSLVKILYNLMMYVVVLHYVVHFGSFFLSVEVKIVS